MSNKKLNIGLIFGGNSSEHEVSIKSAKNIYNALTHSYQQTYCQTISAFEYPLSVPSIDIVNIPCCVCLPV